MVIVSWDSQPTVPPLTRRNVVAFTVEPEEAWRIVVLDRWRILWTSYFDAKAEKGCISYTFSNLEAVSWSGRPPPRNPYKPKR